MWASLLHTIKFNFYDLFVFPNSTKYLTAMGVADFRRLKLFFCNKMNQNNPWRITPYFVTCVRENHIKDLSRKKDLYQPFFLRSSLWQLLPEHSGISQRAFHSGKSTGVFLYCHPSNVSIYIFADI